MTLSTRCVTWALFVFVTATLVETQERFESVFRESNTGFAKALYSKLAGDINRSNNILFSPLGIHALLALVYTGAAGSTAREIANVLNLRGVDVEEVKKGYQELLTGMEKNNNKTTLRIANMIYFRNGFPFTTPFYDTVKLNFYSDIAQMQFDPMALKYINDWVKFKTQGKIKEVVGREILDPNSVTVLLSAVYFQGMWLKDFDKENTISTQFFVTAKRSRSIEMMRVVTRCLRGEHNELGADILILPYNDYSTNLVVILPFKIDGLSEVENKLRHIKLETIFNNVTLKHVEVHLPKFKLEEDLSLNDYLKWLGLREMFGPTANFSCGMSCMSLARPHMSQVLHKAVMEVNEDGNNNWRGLPLPDEIDPTLFLANHPFLFLVHDTRSGAVIFMGRFVDPGVSKPWVPKQKPSFRIINFVK